MNRALAAALCLLLVPLSTAAPVDIGALEATGDLASSSKVHAAVFSGFSSSYGDLTVDAVNAYAIEYRRTATMTDCPTALCPDPVVPDPLGAVETRYPESGQFSNVEFTADRFHQEKVQVVVFPSSETALEVQTSSLVATSMPFACATNRGIEKTSSTQLLADCPEPNLQQATFNTVPVDDASLVFAADAATSATFSGDFVLEFIGIQGSLGSANLDSTDRQEDLGNGAAARYSQGFVRLVLTDATLTLNLTGAQERAQWSAPGSDLMALDATVDLMPVAAVGDAGQQTYAGDYFLAIDPQDDAMSMDIEERAPDGSPLNAAPAAPVWQTGWAWIVLASMVPLLAVAFIVRRIRSHSMADIEMALANGAYPKAIRLSKTMLRRDPDAPSVQLSHAIALTKAGRPREAVDAIRAFLDRGEPSDGTLHYVLGLALHEMGDENAARRAMDDAVRRTPALADDQHEGGAYT